MIVETCPVCGNPLMDSIIATNPPIYRKECYNCGWSWESKPEPIQYVPFIPPDDKKGKSNYD